MATKLCQIIAVCNGKKSRTQAAITELYHVIQKPPLFEGLSRTYRPRDEDGAELPPEEKRIQCRVSDVIERASLAWADLWDAVATQDFANCAASADVKIGGETLLTNVPVTTLIFLEKQLTEVRNLISRLPTLDPVEQWEFSGEANAYECPPAETVKTAKIPRNHVLAEATEHHAAQVQMYTEDVPIGYWKNIKFSAAIPEKERADMLARVEAVIEAVKSAREEANTIEVKDVGISQRLLSYVFSTGTQS